MANVEEEIQSISITTIALAAIDLFAGPLYETLRHFLASSLDVTPTKFFTRLRVELVAVHVGLELFSPPSTFLSMPSGC